MGQGFPSDASGKELAGGPLPPANAGNSKETGSIPGSGKSLREGTGNLLQYSCLENSMERGDWWATVCRIARVGHDLATQPPPS